MEIGIRREDKNIWEKRVPLTPDHIAHLVAAGVRVTVESSELRAFPDSAYETVGAELVSGTPDSPVVLAVKEVPTSLLQPGRTYLYFAHVIKGQRNNMGMLSKLLELGCTLIDYERVVDEQGRRLIFFGRHAGLAGMVDSLWALGQRLAVEGLSTPLTQVRMAHEYPDLDGAREAIAKVGQQISSDGLPKAIAPLVVGFAGYGNVSRGAQEIFDLLPHEAVEPEHLPEVLRQPGSNKLVKVVFKEEHMATPRDPGAAFDLQDYYEHPDRYRGIFARHVPYLSVLINCIYWTPAYPRLVSRELLHGLYGAGHKPRLKVIGDLSIDIEGAIECSLDSTDPGNPVYVYLPQEDRIIPGLEGHGPVVLAVDNLPCELPVEASRDFGDALLPFVEAIARADYDQPFEQLELPAPIKSAVVVHQGRLAPDYEYLSKHLTQQEEGTS